MFAQIVLVLVLVLEWQLLGLAASGLNSDPICIVILREGIVRGRAGGWEKELEDEDEDEDELALRGSGLG